MIARLLCLVVGHRVLWSFARRRDYCARCGREFPKPGVRPGDVDLL